jgi:hypothetical protein
VDSRFYDGTFEVVSALIPGTTGQEVLSVSHLCHPQPSANDNASGVAANIEIAATLRRLIDQGRLPQPARSIRFLWLPEMTGTYAYLSSVEDRLPQVVAGVNLDMVGQDQERCHSTFNIECPPDAMASFAPVLMERLWDLMQPPHAHGPGDGPVGSGGKSGAVRHTVAPFSGGSDHYILSDPTVGVATPMLIQWPDRFYHTSEDTLDKVDPAMLARSGSLAAAYVYAVATAGRREATWLAHEIATRQGHQLACLAQDTITEVLGSADAAEVSRRFHDLERSSAYQLDRDRAALISLLALWPDAGPLVHDMSLALEEAAGRELARARSICLEKAGELGADGLAAPFPSGEAWRSRAGRLRPERHYRGPLAFRSLLEGTTPAERDALWEANHRAGRAWWTARTLAEYWADGQRSISEIADRVQQETGQDFGPQILAFFEFLAGQDAVTLHEAGAVQEVIR